MCASHTFQKSGIGSACFSIDTSLRQAVLTHHIDTGLGQGTSHLAAASPPLHPLLPSSAFVPNFLDPAGLWTPNTLNDTDVSPWALWLSACGCSSEYPG